MVKISKRKRQDALKQVLIPQVPTIGPGLGTSMIPGLPEPPNWLTPWELQPQVDTAGGYDKPEHVIPGIGQSTTPAADEEEKPAPPLQEFIPDPVPDPDEDPLKPPFLLPTTGPPPPPGPSPPGLPDILEVPHPPGGYPEPYDTPPPPKTTAIVDRVPDAPPDECEQWQLLTGLPCTMRGEIQIRTSKRNVPSRSDIRTTYRKNNGPYRGQARATQRSRHTRHQRRRFRQSRSLLFGYLPGDNG